MNPYLTILTRVFAHGTTKSEVAAEFFNTFEVMKLFKTDQSLMLVKVQTGYQDFKFYVTREDYYKSLADEAAAQYVEGLNP